MALRSLRGAGWAVWLGMLALGFEALVPIHFAFDLAEAIGPSQAEIGGQNFQRHLLALLSGHIEDGHPGRADHHHDASCAVCAAVGALGAIGGFAPATAPALPYPEPATPEIALAAAAGDTDGIFPAAYRSRAPPEV